MLLSQAVPGASLDCDFTLAEDSMTIAVSVLSQRAQLPARRHVRLDGALRAGRQRGRLGRAGRQADDHAAEDPRAIEVRVTEEIEVRVTAEGRRLG